MRCTPESTKPRLPTRFSQSGPGSGLEILYLESSLRDRGREWILISPANETGTGPYLVRSLEFDFCCFVALYVSFESQTDAGPCSPCKHVCEPSHSINMMGNYFEHISAMCMQFCRTNFLNIGGVQQCYFSLG